MSEHTRIISSKIIYDHFPYRENGFSYCKHCKKFVGKMEICLNEGWHSDWIQVNCGHCGKAIWVCSFKVDPRDDILTSKKELKRLKKLKGAELSFELAGTRQFPKDDKKCFICKKPTNHYDCVSHGWTFKRVKGKIKETEKYICSNKCYKINGKREAKEYQK